MSASLFNILGDNRDALEFKVGLYIVLGVVAIVIVSLLLDRIRRVIRGLDTAALGVLLLWLGHKAAELKVVSAVSMLLNLIGGTLLGTGLIVFVIIMLIRHKRNLKAKERAKEEKAREEKAREEKAREKKEEASGTAE